MLMMMMMMMISISDILKKVFTGRINRQPKKITMH